MQKLPKFLSIILFLTPIVLSIGLFAFLNPGCQSPEDRSSGTIKLLYTSEVGGRLDPCG